MDVSFELKNVKKIKFKKKQNAIKSRNGIDNLPDAILEHILSYLSTKDAVRTSILSKRWQYLWTSIPKLEFYEEEPDRKTMLMNFVERALALRDSSNIKDFSLSCDVECETHRINSWISAVVKHKVQVLYLGLANFQESLELTPRLFTCESLKELTLSMFHYLKLPTTSVSFPSLKKLILMEVIFPDDNSTQQLFSGCPILEELFIIDCIWNNVKAVYIAPPMLRILYINDANENKDDLNADADGQNESNSCQVKIFGNSLESFSFSGDHLNDFCLLNSSSVVDASIEVFQRDDEDFYVDVQDAHRLYKLLDGLGNVEKLRLQVSSLEVLNYAEELFPLLPVFNNLTSLTLGSELPIEFSRLLTILRNSPCLDFLELAMGITYHGIYDSILDRVPSCLMTHLKTINIFGLSGDEKEIHAIKILLKIALVLKRISISFDAFDFECSGDIMKLKEISAQILSFPKGSSCSIFFC